MEWTEWWPLIVAFISATLGVWRRHRVVGSLRRFRDWFFEIPMMPARLEFCKARCRVYEEVMAENPTLRAIAELRVHGSASGNASKSGAGNEKESSPPTSPTTPPLSASPDGIR